MALCSAEGLEPKFDFQFRKSRLNFEKVYEKFEI